MSESFATILSCWKIQSANRPATDGWQISTAGFNTEDWYETQAPSTVLAALVEAGEYINPYFGRNLNDIPKKRFE